MKYLISSVTIGACLLLSSAGNVFAGAGQQGTGGTGVASCGSTITIGGVMFLEGSPPGQAGHTTSSPFPNAPGEVPSPNYAGAGPNLSSNAPGLNNYGAKANGGANPNGSPNANSQYDVACLQHLQQVP